MSRFFKGVLAGTLLGALAGIIARSGRKPDMMSRIDHGGARLKEKTGKIIKGMARSVDKRLK